MTAAATGEGEILRAHFIGGVMMALPYRGARTLEEVAQYARAHSTHPENLLTLERLDGESWVVVWPPEAAGLGAPR